MWIILLDLNLDLEILDYFYGKDWDLSDCKHYLDSKILSSNCKFYIHLEFPNIRNDLLQKLLFLNFLTVGLMTSSK